MCPTKSDKGKFSQLKTGVFKIRPGIPIEMSELAEAPSAGSNKQMPELSQIGKTIKSYLNAAKELIEGKYALLREVAPIHMTAACTPTAFVFPDGILVRYDLKPNPELKVFVGIIKEEGTLSYWAPRLTESFLHCPAQPDGYDPGDQMASITISIVSPSKQEKRDIAKKQFFAVASLTALRRAGAKTDNRLLPVVSISNKFDLMIEFETMPNEGERGQKFLTRSPFKLPFGWEAIELFPPYDPDTWDPSLAPLWAEMNLLAAITRHNLWDQKLREIDPNAQARKMMAELILQYESLLAGPEEPLHQFIKKNPQLLCPTHDRVWSKLPLGNRISDFVFREPAGGYLLVELEQPSHLLFRKHGQPRQALNHAIDQVMDWRRYLEDNLSTAQRELGLEGISSNPRCLIVIGRSSSLDEGNRRKLTSMENASPWLKIMTYDDLLANAKATAENILGPLWDAGPNTEVYFR